MFNSFAKSTFYFVYSIYLLYAKLEEEHGLGRHAMAVYDRAIEAVEPTERFGLFNIYLKKAADIYGVTRTRQIYQVHHSFSFTNQTNQRLLDALFN